MHQNGPLDDGVIEAFRFSADQFKDAILRGQPERAAGAANAIVSGFTRFFSRELSSFSMMQSAPRQAHSLFELAQKLISNENCASLVDRSIETFKSNLSAGRFSNAISVFSETGMLYGVRGPISELKEMEVRIREDPSSKMRFLPHMAKLALWIGDSSKAERYASEALDMDKEQCITDMLADSVHSANTVLGLIALNRGDVNEAKRRLIASAGAVRSARQKLAGPDIELAKGLLMRGEAYSVLEYFEKYRWSWTMRGAPIDMWVNQIKRNEMPSFHLLQYTGGPILCL